MAGTAPRGGFRLDVGQQPRLQVAPGVVRVEWSLPEHLVQEGGQVVSGSVGFGEGVGHAMRSLRSDIITIIGVLGQSSY